MGLTGAGGWGKIIHGSTGSKKSRYTAPLRFNVETSPKSLGSDRIQVQNTGFHTVFVSNF